MSNKTQAMGTLHHTCGKEDHHSPLRSPNSTTCSNMRNDHSSRHFRSSLPCMPHHNSTMPKAVPPCMAHLCNSTRLWVLWEALCLAGIPGTRLWDKTLTNPARALNSLCNTKVLPVNSLACLAGHLHRLHNREGGRHTRNGHNPMMCCQKRHYRIMSRIHS